MNTKEKHEVLIMEGLQKAVGYLVVTYSSLLWKLTWMVPLD